MGLVDRLAALRYVRTLKRAGTADDRALSDAKEHLVAAGDCIVPSLIELLADPDARPHAIDVLCELIDEAVLPTLIAALEHQSRAVVAGVVEALSRSTAYPAELLLGYLDHPGRIRGHIEAILEARGAGIPPRKLVSSLIDAGKESRLVVFRLLETHARPEMAGSLVEMLRHEDWWVRLHALKVLGQLPSPETLRGVIAMLADPSRNVRLEAVEALGRLDARGAIPELCRALRDPNLKVQSAAIDVLVKFDDVTAVTHLLEVLKDESEQARRGAVEVLNAVATPAAIQDLVLALQDADWWVQARAADALGTLGGPRVVEAVLGLMDAENCHARRYAVEILNSISDARAAERLIRALGDPDWWVRERSIDALAKIGDRRAVEPLIRLMNSDARVAPLCARALGALGDPRAVDVLCMAATAREPELRAPAIDALQRLAEAGVPEDVRRCIAEVLGQVEGGRGQVIPLGQAALRCGPPPAPPQAAARAGAGSGPEATLERGFSGLQPLSAGAVSARASGSAPAAPAAHPPATPDRSGAAAEPPPDGRPAPGTTLAEWLSLQGPAVPAGAGSAGAGTYDLQPGVTLLGRYRIIRRVGSGGFGTVYLVSDITVQEELILKVLSPHITNDPMMIRRFVHELKYARRISHRNIIRIHDLLQFEGGHAISMEFFPGRDLGAILAERGRLAPGRVLHIARQVCDGLSAAHAEGVIHRDIKPANILLGEADMVKIVDFGLAAMTQSAGSRLTRSGILIGTPHYMAPEQIKGDDVDGRADIYSVGVMMYEMLSGRQPYCGDSAVNILFQHLEGRAQPLSELVPDIPPEIETLVTQFMARNRDDRPPGVAGCLESIDRLAA